MLITVMKEISPAVLKTAEAAKYIGSSKSELDRARISGELSGLTPPKFFRIGQKAVRYKVTDLDEWLNVQKTFTTIASEGSHCNTGGMSA
ncbi:MAG: helix-turn-helix transcriptional regulator [Endozoicomonas sp.]